MYRIGLRINPIVKLGLFSDYRICQYRALNLDVVGKKIGPFTRPYDWEDLALYALGVGAGLDELD